MTENVICLFDGKNGGKAMEFNETNWKECLESLNFTEGKNESFGGMVVYDDKGIPKFDYDSEERKRMLFIFLSGALYMKNHMIYG